MFRKIIYFGVLLSLFSTNVQAEKTGRSIYMGIQATQTTYEDDFIEVEPGALVLRIGEYVEDGAAVEARVGFGMNGMEDTLNNGGFVYNYDVESIMGLYGLYHLGAGSSASVYGILGLTRAEIKEFSFFGRASLEETSLSAGIGLNFAGFNFEYMHYLFDSNFEFTAISAGYVSKF
jgi:hypothetical protein